MGNAQCGALTGTHGWFCNAWRMYEHCGLSSSLFRVPGANLFECSRNSAGSYLPAYLFLTYVVLGPSMTIKGTTKRMTRRWEGMTTLAWTWTTAIMKEMKDTKPTMERIMTHRMEQRTRWNPTLSISPPGRTSFLMIIYEWGHHLGRSGSWILVFPVRLLPDSINE